MPRKSNTRGEADWRSQYPFRSHWLDLEGHRYHYVDEGQGSPLLLVHGNPTWSFYWRNLIAGLRPGYRLIAPDHLGCGLSDKPQDYAYRLKQHIDNLCRLVEHLDLQQVTLVGHDWGGAIGMGTAARLPDRFARFVLLNTAAFRSQRIPWRIRICRTPVLGEVAIRGANAFARAARWMATERPRELSPEAVAGYLAPYDRWASRIATHRFVADIPLSPRHPSYGDLLHVEESLVQWKDYPWLLIWGMRDWCFTPHFLERFQGYFPRAEVERIEHAGHWVVEDAPAEVLGAMERFLQRHPLPAAA